MSIQAYSMGKKEIKEVQARKLKEVVTRVYENSPFYRRRLKEAGIDIANFRPEDIRKVPFTTKTDLRDNYPLGLISVDKSKIVRMHASSGTTGNPTVVAYTKRDIDA
ncbi:MAG: phenylacetate--CoA ligase, partial [Candidatus Methanosuratincola petrocarbonis]